MTRRVVIALTLIAGLVLGLAVDAAARYRVTRLHAQPMRLRIHKASAPAPQITSFTPLKSNVGQKLTILGKNFRSGKDNNRVFFLRQGGGITSAKPVFASKTRIVVTIPDTITPLLRSTGRTRFQLRILTSLYGKPTQLSSSPLIGRAVVDPGPGPGPGPIPINSPGGDCDLDKIVNSQETDDDNDLVPDTTEAVYTHTDACKPDTDGDGISDGYEWQSAKDLNDVVHFGVADAARPYPGKKPWPNPLDPTDAAIDHDGDGLTMIDEFQLFKYFGSGTLPLNYSAGKQRSKPTSVPLLGTLDYMDINHSGFLSDDERDADGDNLGNWDEMYGRMTQGWWDSEMSGQGGQPKETHYYLLDRASGEVADFPDVSAVDPDSDGDLIPDGDDDQDHDGLSNSFEISRPWDWQMTYVSNTHNGPAPEDYADFDPPGPLPESPWDPAMYPNTHAPTGVF